MAGPVGLASRVLAVFAAFEHSASGLSVNRISQRAGIPLSSTYRIVNELEEWGALERMPGGKYQIGMRMWELGQMAGRQLRDRARPFLQDLFDLTHENVHMAVREGTHTLYVDKIYGSKKMPLISRVGGRLPLHSTAVGRVLLSAQPDWFIKAYLGRELEAPTAMSVIDPEALRREIVNVSQEGFSVTVEQMRVGKLSLATPVVVDEGTVAAVGLVLDKSKLSEITRLKPLLKGTADRIAKVMSGVSVSSG